MVNFPDLPLPPQWLKDIIGDTSRDGLRGFWAGSHMLAGGTDHFKGVYTEANRGLSEGNPHFLTDQSKFNGVLQLSGTAVRREDAISVKQASPPGCRVGANPPYRLTNPGVTVGLTRPTFCSVAGCGLDGAGECRDA